MRFGKWVCVGILLLPGCSNWYLSPLPRESFCIDVPPVRFCRTISPQEAVFFVSQGWLGGHGEAVLGANQAIITMNNKAVFLSPEARKQIMARTQLPLICSSNTRILVHARIRLEPAKGVKYRSDGEYVQSYYSLVIDELLDVRCYEEPTNKEVMRNGH
jgi:hypothetical protein